MRDINVNLLSTAEAAEYDRLRRAAVIDREGLVFAYIGAALVWLGIWVGLLILSLYLDKNEATSDASTLLGWIAFAAAVVGWIPILSVATPRRLAASKESKAKIDEFLVRIRYHRRYGPNSRTNASADSYNSQATSRRQMQHEWYEGHSELDWRDRQTAEMYGMDVDTYISNVLENDKD